MNTYRLFCGKVAEQKKLRKLTNGDLAKLTGYSVKTIVPKSLVSIVQRISRPSHP